MRVCSVSRLLRKGSCFLLVCTLLTGIYTLFSLMQHRQEQSSGENSEAVVIPDSFAWQRNFKAAILGDSELFPLLKVAVPPRTRLAGLLSPYGDGLNRDLLEYFARDYGFNLQFSEVPSLAQASELLIRGEVDLAAGFIAPADFIRNSETNAPDIALSPAYQNVSPALLYVGKSRSRESKLMVLDPEVSAVVKNAAALEKAPLSDDIFDLMNYLEQGHTGYAVVGSAYLSMLLPIFSDVRTSVRTLDGNAGRHWIWRDDSSLAALSLESFWKDKDTLRLLDDLHEKYWAFLPLRPNRSKIAALVKGLERELEQYHKSINAAAREFNIDPLLLTAVIYQESQFRHTMGDNGQGLMQLTRSTADSLGVNADEPSANIRGGAKYLRLIFDSLPDDLPYWDRWFLTLAGYNQGPGMLKAAIRLAGRDNETLNWRAVKETYLYLESHPEAINRSQVRGRHVVNYVQNVRYYYYILNGLVILDRPEAQHLTPLLAAVRGARPVGM